jgi:hypothetical protein
LPSTPSASSIGAALPAPPAVAADDVLEQAKQLGYEQRDIAAFHDVLADPAASVTT